MAKQERAIRTRQAILLAAAKVFQEHGYEAATIAEILATAGFTKGALYFHFGSKEELALGILGEQDLRESVPSRACKVQELVDSGMLQAYQLQTNPLVRAGVRLTLEHRADGLDRSGPFRRWSLTVQELLEKAQAQGELLPHAVPAESADVLVGAFAGVQAMSHALCDYQDLQHRTSVLLRHTLPSIVVSSVLCSVDLSENRGQEVFTELQQLRDDVPEASSI